MLPCEHFALDNTRSASRYFVGYNLDFLGLPPYSTVGNFRGRKLLQISEKTFLRQNFHRCLTGAVKRCRIPKFHRENIHKDM